MAFSFRNEVILLLKSNSTKYFTAREIAEYIAEKFPEACEEKMKNSKGGVGYKLIGYSMRIIKTLLTEIHSI